MIPTKIIIGCDHGGYALKKQLIPYITAKGILVEDVGCPSEESVDYPLYAGAVCRRVQRGEGELGILICGTGVGMSMCANKHKGIRAACVSDAFSARLTRQHNNANVLCIGGRVVGYGTACDLVDAFLFTDYEGGDRHERRLGMMAELEK